jgi:diadenosine tetraphosphate (Ap4A) HIT family hydrolase
MGTEMTCPFCVPFPSEKVLENSLAWAKWDKYPVTEGHILVIPKRHIAGYFEATPEEKGELWALVDECRKILQVKFKPDGYNIGINEGASAGQTIFHLHIHLIPRRKGDMENPRGGVRHVIPSKGNY